MYRPTSSSPPTFFLPAHREVLGLPCRHVVEVRDRVSRLQLPARGVGSVLIGRQLGPHVLVLVGQRVELPVMTSQQITRCVMRLCGSQEGGVCDHVDACRTDACGTGQELPDLG
jgi:hypothetical protein